MCAQAFMRNTASHMCRQSSVEEGFPPECVCMHSCETQLHVCVGIARVLRKGFPECVHMLSCELQLHLCRHSSRAWSHDHWKRKCHPGSVWAEKTTARLNNFHPSRCGSKVPRASTSGYFASTPSAKPPRGGPPKATGSSHVCAHEHHQATDAFGLIHVGVGLCVAELPLEEPEEKEQVGAFCLAIEVGSEMPLFWWHGGVLRASHPGAVWCTGLSTRGLEQTTALRHTHRR